MPDPGTEQDDSRVLTPADVVTHLLIKNKYIAISNNLNHICTFVSLSTEKIHFTFWVVSVTFPYLYRQQRDGPNRFIHLPIIYHISYIATLSFTILLLTTLSCRNLPRHNSLMNSLSPCKSASMTLSRG